jgi:hypothetical protein
MAPSVGERRAGWAAPDDEWKSRLSPSTHTARGDWTDRHLIFHFGRATQQLRFPRYPAALPTSFHMVDRSFTGRQALQT